MKKFLSLLVILITFPICSFAHVEVKDTISVDTQEINETTEVQTVDVLDLQKQIKELIDKVNKLTETENILKGKQFDDQQIIEAHKATIRRLEQRLVFADSIVARLSNDCLRKKYDAEKVSNAISNFDQMYSVELKSNFNQLRVLLTQYGKYTKEIESVFIEAQNDKDIGNPFTGQKQALTYIDKIKGTSYYRDVYDKNWTIPYLDSIIDKSIEVIKSFNPKESKELHLIELMK